MPTPRPGPPKVLDPLKVTALRRQLRDAETVPAQVARDLLAEVDRLNADRDALRAEANRTRDMARLAHQRETRTRNERDRLAHQVKTASPARVWDEGFTAGFYKGQIMPDRDASEADTTNPYDHESSPE